MLAFLCGGDRAYDCRNIRPGRLFFGSQQRLWIGMLLVAVFYLLRIFVLHWLPAGSTPFTEDSPWYLLCLIIAFLDSVYLFSVRFFDASGFILCQLQKSWANGKSYRRGSRRRGVVLE